LGRLQVGVVSAVVSGIVVGSGAYYLGHAAGEREPRVPSAAFVRQQQADALGRLVDSSRELIGIEHDSVELLAGKGGGDVDVGAFFRLRTRYTKTYDQVLSQMGRIGVLFDDTVLADAKDISHSAAVALTTLYPLPRVLPGMTAAEVHAIVVNSHLARKGQWAALRKFSHDATGQLVGGQ